MKVSKKHTDGDLVTLEVTCSSAEVGDALNQAGAAFCGQMGLQPEPTRSPAQVASERLGIKNLDDVVVQQAMEHFVPLAISKSGMDPAYNPLPEPKGALKRGQAFQFEMQVMEKPEYELSNYEPIAFTMPEFKVNDEAVDRQISQMARSVKNYVAADPHPLEDGDVCKLQLEVKKGDEVIPGLTTDERSYEVGQGFMPQGFDENILGMDVGETREFTFEGPDFDEDFNQFMAEFSAKVTLLEIQKETVPVIDDEWVKKNMPLFKDYKDMRAALTKQVEHEQRKMYEEYKRNAAAAELAKRFEGSIADELYEGTMREIQQRIYQQVTASGQSWDDFVAQNGGEQQMNMMTMLQTRESLVTGFVLDAWYRHFKLQYSEQDIDEVCAAMNPQNPKAAREAMEKNGYGYSLRESSERLCAVKNLVETAQITYVDPAAVDEDIAEAVEEAVEEEIIEEAVEEVVEELIEEAIEDSDE